MWNPLRPFGLKDLYSQTILFPESYSLSLTVNMNSLICGYEKEALLASAPHSQLTHFLIVSENKHGANSCSSVPRQAFSSLSKAWQQLLWDGGSHHGDEGVVPSPHFPAT